MATLIIWFMCYSIFGWLYETVVCSIRRRTLVKRGFLYGPYCPIYGFGALLALAFLGWASNPWVLFFGGMVVAAPLEYGTGAALEKLFHRKYWDYSNQPGNIKGRICPLGLVIFGGLAWLLIDFAQPALASATAAIPPVERIVVACILLSLFLIDVVKSVQDQAPDDANFVASRSRLRAAFAAGPTSWSAGSTRADRMSAAFGKLGGSFSHVRGRALSAVDRLREKMNELRDGTRRFR